MKKERSEYGQIVLDVARVARVVKGGRRFRFRVVVAIGNKKGKIGLGIAKGPDVSVAMNKANMKAKKNLVELLIVNGTIPHETMVKYGSTTIFLKPAPQGAGIIAGSALRSVIELSGIKNIFSKIHGSTNKINTARAVLEALSSLRNPEMVARERGVDVSRLQPRKIAMQEMESQTDSAEAEIPLQKSEGKQ